MKRLAEDGNKVHALVYGNKTHPFLKGMKIKKFSGDVTDKDSLRDAMEGCSQVYNVAGMVSYLKKDFKKMMDVHVRGTKNVMEVASELGVKKMVQTSSCAAIGLPESPEKPQDEKTKWDKKYDKVGYMHTKKLAEDEIKKFRGNGMKIVMVNPTSFFGQGDINMNEGELVRNIKNGVLKFATPGGNSVVSVDDTVEGHLLAMSKGRDRERYILSNEFMPFIEIFNIIADELGKKKIDYVLPKSSFYLAYGASCMAEKTCSFFGIKNKLSPHIVNFSFKYRYYKSDKARSELGWLPGQSFRESIKKAINFYEENGLI